MGSYRKNRSKAKMSYNTFGIIIATISILLLIMLFLPFTKFMYKWLVGFFGLTIYPILLICLFSGVAIALNRKFTMTKRNVVYLVVSALAFVSLLHTIFSSSYFREYGTDISMYGRYIKTCSNAIEFLTVGGILSACIVYPFVSLLGTVGACVFFTITLVIMVSLTIDYYINIQSYLEKMYAKRANYERKNKNYTRPVVQSDSIASVTMNGINSKLKKKYNEEDYVGRINSDEALDPSPNFDDYNNIISTTTAEPIEKMETAESRRASESALKTLYGDEKYESNTNHNIYDDEKAKSNYDPSKFNSLSEYINYPYVPQQFLKKEEDSYEEDSYETAEKENYSNSYMNTFETSNVEEDNYSNTNNLGYNNNSYNDDEDEKTSNFEESFSFDNLGGNNFDFSDDENEQNSDFNSFNFDNSEEESSIVPDNFSFGRERNGRGPDRTERAKRTDRSSENVSRSQFGSPRSFLDNPIKEEPEQMSIPVGKKNIFRTNEVDAKYNAPPTSLLKYRSDDISKYGSDYKEKSKQLEDVLASFKIDAKVVNVLRGPSVTQYQMSMPYGVSVKKVLAFDDDIKGAMKSAGGVRLEAPVPGTNYVGVEVPNDTKSNVGLRELLESKEFANTSAILPVVIGKNILGDVVVKSLPKMVHMLVAGSTGSGKSVFLHSLILSLMFKCSPSQLRFILIDPKRVEFISYSGMPHMMLPHAVCEVDKAINALGWAVKEMDRRFSLMQKYSVQNIEDYNALSEVKSGQDEKIPYIVLVIDELNDLMVRGKKEVEEKVMRLAQLGRASGIHMIIATQRPSADVITGTIKNNLPTRVTFKLGSQIDSRVILDEPGAEKLLGAGDMLISPVDSPALIRLQGGYMKMDEVKAVVEYIKENNQAYFDEELSKQILEGNKDSKSEQDSASGEGGRSSDDDELLPAVLRHCINVGGASTSMIQRKFRVGFSRAGRIIDQLQEAGYISEPNGSKLRTVFITMDQYHEIFGEDD